MAGKIIAGPWVKLACERHLWDLAEGKKRGLRWDLAAALRATEFFPDVLRLAEGEHAGEPFQLQPWEQFIVGSIFGWMAGDGYRRFRNVYIEVAKGNGKTPLAAGVGLYMMAADGEAGAHCFAAATTREQADIMFQDAVKMVAASPALSKRILTTGKQKVTNLAYLPTGSFFRAISAERRGLDGKRVHFAAIDEVHEHPTDVVIEKMRAGTKGRTQAIILEITNSGYDRHSVCWRHHEYSIKVLERHFPNDAWFAYICGLDPDEEENGWAHKKTWIKANPNLGVSIHEKYLREQVQEAQEMPAKENIVKRLNFCIWTEAAKRWMQTKLWDACFGAHGVRELERLLEDMPCYGGLDLALTRDLSAFVLLFPPSEKLDKWATLAWFWCPDADIQERCKRDHVPYDLWVRDGWLEATPGNIADHDFIETRIRQCMQRYQVHRIGFDRALAAQLVTHLKADTTDDFMVEVAQGPLTMNAPICTLEKYILGAQLAHGGNPMLRWCFSNVAVRYDSNRNVKFDKEKSTERIDGMTALANATAVSLGSESETPYSAPDVMVV